MTGYGTEVLYKYPFPLIPNAFYIAATGNALVTYNHTEYDCCEDHFDLLMYTKELCFRKLFGNFELISCTE